MRLQDPSMPAINLTETLRTEKKLCVCVCDERYLVLYDVCINQVYSRLCH